jgi:hypothetical protein
MDKTVLSTKTLLKSLAGRLSIENTSWGFSTAQIQNYCWKVSYITQEKLPDRTNKVTGIPNQQIRMKILLKQVCIVMLLKQELVCGLLGFSWF